MLEAKQRAAGSSPAGGIHQHVAALVQLVRTPDCGSGGRRFETDMPPQATKTNNRHSHKEAQEHKMK